MSLKKQSLYNINWSCFEHTVACANKPCRVVLQLYVYVKLSRNQSRKTRSSTRFLACSEGVSFGRANFFCSGKRHFETFWREEEMGRVKGREDGAGRENRKTPGRKHCENEKHLLISRAWLLFMKWVADNNKTTEQSFQSKDSHCLKKNKLEFVGAFILTESQCNSPQLMTGLKITAGQRTMSGLIADLTGQTPVLPVILTGHFWIQTFYFPYSCCLMFYNAAMSSLFLGVFLLFALNPSKKKNTAIN